MVVFSVLMPFAVVGRARTLVRGPFAMEAVLLGLTTASVMLFYVIAQRELHREWKFRVRDVPLILALGVGMCVNNAWAVVEALVGRETPFVRTAKYRIESLGDRWKSKVYRSARRRSFFAELVLTVYMTVGFGVIAWMGEWAALPYMGLFTVGCLYVFALSVAHARH